MADKETCEVCGTEVRMQIMKNTRLCSELCRKFSDGQIDREELELQRKGVQTNAG